MSENTSEKAPINVEKQLVKEVSAQDKMDEITNDSEDEINCPLCQGHFELV